MIHARTQAHIRATALRFLTETCDILSEAHGSGPAGDDVIIETKIGDDVQCRMISAGQANSSASDLLAARETLSDMYTLILPQEQTIDVDHIVIHNDIRYSVVRLETEWTDKPFRKVIVTRKR